MYGYSLNPLGYFEVEIQQFFYDIIIREVDLRKIWEAHIVRRALNEVNEITNDLQFPIVHDSASKIIAYLIKYGACHTSAVAKFLHKLVYSNGDIIRPTFEKRVITVCCLGEGAATEAVAIIRIVRDLYQPYWWTSKKTLKLNLILAGLSGEWQDTAKTILGSLKNSPAWLGTNEIELFYRILKDDHSQKRYHEVMKEALREADIVTMVNLLSNVYKSKVKDSCSLSVENIVLSMKKEAVLFVLESTADQHYNYLKEFAKKKIIMHEIYQPFANAIHTISFDSVKKFLELYSRYFHRFVCSTNISLRGGSWKKLKNARTVISTSNAFTPLPKAFDEDGGKITNKLEVYHVYIQKLIDEKFTQASKSNIKSPIVSKPKQETADLNSKNFIELFDNSLHSFDTALQQLYYDAINRELNLRPKWKQHCLKRASNEIENTFSSRTIPIPFKNSLMRCAYLLKYSTCFTSAVAKYFLKVSSSTDSILKAAFIKGVCVICCLGGGPATDIVGLLRTLQDLYKPYWNSSKKQLKIQVVIVDLEGEWIKTIGNVFQCLLNTPELFCPEEAELLCMFLKADLSQEMNLHVVNAIQNADLITAVHSFSVIHNQRTIKDSFHSLIQNIVLNMKNDSLLFFLDRIFDNLDNVLKDITGEEDLIQLHGPDKLELHTLSLESIKKFIDLYSEYFNQFLCISNILLCFGLWKKTMATDNKKSMSKPIINERLIRSVDIKTEKDKLIEKINQYQALVEKIVDEKFNTAINKCKNTNIQPLLSDIKNATKNSQHSNYRGKKKSDLTVAERLLYSARLYNKV